MIVWCVGLGPIGSIIAARLVRAGVDVIGFDTDTEHIRRLREPGLVVEGLGDGPPTRIQTRGLEEPTDVLSLPDVLILGDRPDATLQRARSLLPSPKLSTQIVCLTDGPHAEVIAQEAGNHRVIIATPALSASWLGPGRVSLDRYGHLTLKRLDGTRDEPLESVRQLLGSATPTVIAAEPQKEAPTEIPQPPVPSPPPPTTVPVITDGVVQAPRDRPRRRIHISRRAYAAAALIAAAVLVFFAGRLVGRPDTPGPPSDVETPSGTPVPQATPSAVGKPIQTIEGNTLTVHTVESSVRSNREVVIAAEEGKKLAAVDVEFCIREDFGGNGTVLEQQFQVETGDGKKLSFWDTPDHAKDPRFANAEVKPGNCSRGWITFEIPEDESIVRVHWSPAEGSPEQLQWDVSRDGN